MLWEAFITGQRSVTQLMGGVGAFYALRQTIEYDGHGRILPDYESPKERKINEKFCEYLIIWLKYL